MLAFRSSFMCRLFPTPPVVGSSEFSGLRTIKFTCRRVGLTSVLAVWWAQNWWAGLEPIELVPRWFGGPLIAFLRILPPVLYDQNNHLSTCEHRWISWGPLWLFGPSLIAERCWLPLCPLLELSAFGCWVKLLSLYHSHVLMHLIDTKWKLVISLNKVYEFCLPSGTRHYVSWMVFQFCSFQ